ncbi:MAG: PqqD family protein [Acidobacteriota bacterium]|jgi:hypothetical protein|nr:PqqD family protein [Acidobacteriota bacterium]
MRKKPGFELRCVGGEDILVPGGVENVDFSRIIAMNSSSAWLWREVGDGDFTAATLAQMLVAHYEIDSVTAEDAAAELLTQWRDAGILVP